MVPIDRPLERRTAARTAVVWDALRPLVEGSGRVVVDIGGGTGGFAVGIAETGHHVTVVDPSPDALAAAARRADERGVAERVTGVQGDLTDLVELVGEQGADLVLCHGVLGLVDDPAAGLASIARVLRPGGALSLLVSQRHAAVLARAMAGHFNQARELLAGAAPGPTDPRGAERRFGADEIGELVRRAGLTVEAVHAVRVFVDLVPSSLLDLDAGATEALVELEREVASRPEYLALAAQVHLVARREAPGN